MPNTYLFYPYAHKHSKVSKGMTITTEIADALAVAIMGAAEALHLLPIVPGNLLGAMLLHTVAKGREEKYSVREEMFHDRNNEIYYQLEAEALYEGLEPEDRKILNEIKITGAVENISINTEVDPKQNTINVIKVLLKHDSALIEEQQKESINLAQKIILLKIWNDKFEFVRKKSAKYADKKLEFLINKKINSGKNLDETSYLNISFPDGKPTGLKKENNNIHVPIISAGKDSDELSIKLDKIHIQSKGIEESVTLQAGYKVYFLEANYNKPLNERLSYLLVSKCKDIIGKDEKTTRNILNELHANELAHASNDDLLNIQKKYLKDKGIEDEKIQELFAEIQYQRTLFYYLLEDQNSTHYYTVKARTQLDNELERINWKIDQFKRTKNSSIAAIATLAWILLSYIVVLSAYAIIVGLSAAALGALLLSPPGLAIVAAIVFVVFAAMAFNMIRNENGDLNYKIRKLLKDSQVELDAWEAKHPKEIAFFKNNKADIFRTHKVNEYQFLKKLAEKKRNNFLTPAQENIFEKELAKIDQFNSGKTTLVGTIFNAETYFAPKLPKEWKEINAYIKPELPTENLLQFYTENTETIKQYAKFNEKVIDENNESKINTTLEYLREKRKEYQTLEERHAHRVFKVGQQACSYVGIGGSVSLSAIAGFALILGLSSPITWPIIAVFVILAVIAGIVMIGYQLSRQYHKAHNASEERYAKLSELLDKMEHSDTQKLVTNTANNAHQKATDDEQQSYTEEKQPLLTKVNTSKLASL